MLDTWARGRIFPYRKVVRARIITTAADGVLNRDIANALIVSRSTVQLWRERFLALRLTGVEKDAPHLGRKPKVSERKIRALVEATFHTPL
jgi:transposase